MRPEVEKYFADTFGGIAGFIQAGRRLGIEPDAMKAACELVYDSVKPADTIVLIGQKVHIQARRLQKARIHNPEKRIDAIEAKVNEINNARLSKRL